MKSLLSFLCVAAIAVGGLTLMDLSPAASQTPAASMAPAPEASAAAKAGNTHSQAPQGATAGAAAEATPLPEATWSLGSRRVYDVTSDQQIRVALDGDAAKAGTLSLGLHGRLSATVVGREDGAVHLELALKEPELTVAPAAPAEARDVVREQLGQRFFATIDPDGRVSAVHFQKGLEPFVEGLLEALVAHLQVVRPTAPATRWDTEESDPVGDYAAHYERVGELELRRTKLRYMRVVSLAGLVPTEQAGRYSVSGAERLRLDAEGQPVMLEGREQLDSGESTGRGSATTTTQLKLRLVETGRDDSRIGSLERAWSQLTSRGTGQQQRVERLAAQMDRQAAGAATFERLHAELRGLQGAEFARQRAELMPRLEARFRLNPEATAAAARAILSGTEGADTVRTLVGALSGAGSAEAQQALATVMSAPQAAADTRLDAIGALGLSKNPTAETVAALHQATLSDDADVHNTAVLATGNAARNQAAAGDSADHTVELLTAGLDNAASDAERADCLRGLGNAGSADTFAKVQEQLSSPSADVRDAAIRALRFMDTPAADAALSQILDGFATAPPGDLEAAVFSASFRPLESQLGPLGNALRGSQNEGIRRDIIGLLATHYQESDDAEALLQWAAQHDGSAELRAAAQAALASTGLIPAP